MLGLQTGFQIHLQGAIYLFYVSISLTEEGEIQYKKVIDYVYQFINQIKSESPKEYIYEEY